MGISWVDSGNAMEVEYSGNMCGLHFMRYNVIKLIYSVDVCGYGGTLLFRRAHFDF
jgi:hypothetical protein